MFKMKSLFFLVSLICLIIWCCENENIEEKYYQSNNDTNQIDTNDIDTGDVDTTDDPIIIRPVGEIAWFPLNGNLNDSTGNNIPILLVGDQSYTNGLNAEFGSGVHLDGASYLMINLGYYDTLSILFWIKGDEAVGNIKKPVLLDYGLNSISAQLDGSSGATVLHVNKNDYAASSSDVAELEALNSFCRYSFIYFEAGGDLTRVYFKGYYQDGAEKIYNADLEFPGIIDPKSEILYIGRSSDRDNFIQSFFQGSIDEIHIYSHPLTNQEIESYAFTPTE
jgi:hypothetical protein